jgi:thymidylate kinase
MRQTDILRELAPKIQTEVESSLSPILVSVLHDFRQKAISYCYWKSSRNVHSVLAGQSDLDLLVARNDQHRCQIILMQRGLKLFPTMPCRDHPALLSFLGYDELTGRLVHVHLHFRLITGDRLLKNYHLPWEDVILARAITHPTLPIKILDPASEALMLIVRGCLELRRRDPVTFRHWQTTTQKFARDRRTFAAQVDSSSVHDLAAALLNKHVANEIVDAIYDEKPLEDQRSLRRHVQTCLTPYRTYNMAEERMRAAWRAVLWIAGGLNKRLLHLLRPWGRRAPGGGAVVAIVGLDGSGKSSVAAAVMEWFGSEIDAIPMYFGTGDGRPSLLLFPFKKVVPLITRLLRTRPKGSSHGNISSHGPGVLYGVLLTIWAAVVAREKRSKLLAARRGANRGLIVLTDRYPQNELLSFNDGPLLVRLTYVPRWLRRFEASAYALARRLPPDLVIKLQVTARTAEAREPTMDPSVIRERIEAMHHLTFNAKRVVTVNAEAPLAEVIRRTKSEIWNLL